MKKPNLIKYQSDSLNWDEWLEETEAYLKKIGYRKYKQDLKHEDYAYWKKFDGYQVGILFYDFRKYQNQFNVSERIGIQFECMLTDIEDRVDLSVCKDILLSDFEAISKEFYNNIKKII